MSMACPPVRDWHLYDLGAFDPARQAALADHLATCVACRTIRAELADIDDALIDLHADYRPDAAARDALVAALPPRMPRRARWVSTRALWRVAAAVVLLAGAGWWLVGARQDDSARLSERQLAESMAVVEFVIGHAGDTLQRMPVGLGGLPIDGGGPGS